MDWDGKISALKGLIGQTGPLWSGTRLSGYAESGPYHCGDCEYMFKGLGSQMGRPDAPTLCKHHIVVADKEIRQRSGGFPMVSAANGCCEFVEPKGKR